MKIKDIHIDGFGVWTDLAVDSLPDGMTLFYGPNEAGKTTLMQFIRASFYGFTPDRRQRYLPPVYGGVPGGAMRVTGPGGGYQIRRRVHSTESESAEQSIVGQLTVTGSDGLSQGQHRLQMLLGQIDEAIFTNVFAIGLRELQELSTLDDTSAADELYKLSSGLDRVSLVDVMRSLRGARNRLIDSRKDDPEAGRLAKLIDRRDKLRDEVAQLTMRSRRWSDLATQRRTQDQEIVALRGRMHDWEHEARCVELATTVRDKWLARQRLIDEINRLEGTAEVPDEAPGQLIQLEAQLEERNAKIEVVKKQRRELRDKWDALPVSRRLMELQGKIEAAGEQSTWIEALEEQITKLDTQIQKAKQELDHDAERLGLDEDDRSRLAEGSGTSLPDLSRQALTALSGPSRAVKENLYELKRARDESLKEKKEADALANKLAETLDRTQADNLHDAIKRQGVIINTMRQRIQIEEQLDKAKRHYRELEQESLDLATSEALPVDRTIILAIPFAFGGLALIYGFFHLMKIESFVQDPDQSWGMMYVLIGFFCMVAWYLLRERGDQGTSLEYEDCERQIDTLRRQISEIELERDEIEQRLPSGTGSLEMRMREAEDLHQLLESLLPTYHGNQAAMERYRAARKRASEAADGLKVARINWKRTVQSLGLSESMSPSSIRKLSEGYETLQAGRKRIETLEEEREQRRRELAALAKRVEHLYLEVMGDDENQSYAKSSMSHDSHSNSQSSSSDRDRRDRDGRDREARDRDNRNRDQRNRDDRQAGKASRDRQEDFDSLDSLDELRETKQRRQQAMMLRKSPLEQLNHLEEELSRQQHLIKRRRELKELDIQLKKQHAAHVRAIDRIDGMRRSLWAKCGVATAEQFYQMVDTKTRLAEMKSDAAELESHIRSVIGNHCEYEEIQRELEGTKSDDLNRRWESLTKRMTETEERIGGLQTRQGELAQEMKMLAEDKRLSHAQLELECIERQLDSISRRWQTLAMSSCLLEDVCATFEKERQPETLREASSFLGQLTDGKYVRIWTPLGTNQLKVDTADGKALSIELLSRGTREAVFIALRLALAAAYARRGVMLPLVLDDVLVNFDRRRAIHAARTLKTFAELGHQVMMFTCHDHIAEIFHDIDVQVRLLPPQGQPGIAAIMPPPERVEEEYYEEEPEDEEVYEEEAYEEEEIEEVEEEPVMEEEPEPEPIPKPEPVVVQIEPPKPKPVPKPLPVVVKPEPKPEPVIKVEPPKRPKPVAPPPPAPAPIVVIQQPEPEPEPELDWVWYQRDFGSEWFDDSEDTEAAPPEVWQRPDAWWNDSMAVTKKK